MPKVKMNTLWLARVSREPAEYSDSEAWGLRLRVSPTALVWSFVYRVPRSNRVERVTIGRHPAIGLAEARKAATDLRNQIYQGHDPAAGRRQESHDPTFGEVAAEYLKRHAVNMRTAVEERRIIEHDLLSPLGTRKLHEITRRRILAVLDDIIGRGAPIMANRTLGTLSRIFNWAISRDLVEANPCFRLRRPAPEQTRDRWLSDDEIRAVWEATGPERITGPLFQVLLLTAQRKGEVQGMTWGEIDLRAATWTLPADRSKNGRSHEIPLSPFALEIITGQAHKNDYVFPSPRPSCGHVTNLGKAAARVKALSGVDFHIHDLRRTAATGMARLGIGRITIEAYYRHLP